ncbi:MAG: sugar ABC transporter permease [Clostridia bacterium]|mgnify:FL=1|nr:sugar ABC transporter permease [Clostridia bacterium]
MVFWKGDKTVNRAVENTSPLLKPKKRKLGKVLWDQKWLLVMSVPVLLYVFLFNYYPLWGWRFAFQNLDLYTIKKGADWIGFGNFEWLFNEKYFWLGFRNTLAMSLINLVFGTLASILLAILLNEVRTRAFKRTVQTVTYLPHFLSMVIVVGMAQNMFVSDGPINQMLLSLGIIDKPIWWLGEGKYFWFLVGLINIWKEVGWNSIIYISTMTSIDPTLYEAAAIDGAGRFQRILHVTLPGIKSTFVVLLIMNIGHLMEAGFEIQYLLGNKQVYDYSQTIDVFVLEYGIQNNKYGRAIAAGMFKSVIGIILLFAANFVAKKLDEDTLL